MQTANTEFAVLLRRHRLGAGLSQEALAESANLSSNAISDLERGIRKAPYPSTIHSLSRALKLSPAASIQLGAAVDRHRKSRHAVLA
jgi:transcriptional regulator with XRE-family HTH domain